jgi:hypothetical protein
LGFLLAMRRVNTIRFRALEIRSRLTAWFSITITVSKHVVSGAKGSTRMKAGVMVGFKVRLDFPYRDKRAGLM